MPALLVTSEELLPQCQWGGGWELRDGGTSKEHFSGLVDELGGGSYCSGAMDVGREKMPFLPVHALVEGSLCTQCRPAVKVSLRCGHVMQ